MSEPETKKTKVQDRPPATPAGDSSIKKAIITGITGQDGSYLAEFLLDKVSGSYVRPLNAACPLASPPFPPLFSACVLGSTPWT